MDFVRHSTNNTAVSLTSYDYSYYANRQSNKIDFVLFQDETRQSASSVGASVNIDAIGANFRVQYRRVTVDDNFSEIVLTKKEVLSDPKQVLFPLPRQSNTRPHSGMHKEEIPVCE